jgi:radical SAM family uncharacterized protein/radical SAM-linked protein
MPSNPFIPSSSAPDFGATDLLVGVQNPSRYIGGETNAVKKPWDTVALRTCLVFPDTYEIGISNMGLQILYRIINDRSDALAERAYAPWPDYEQALRKAGRPLASLESRHPLGEFDLLGISLPYELTYTNILNVIDLAGIPLEAAHRDDSHPLVIGGGAGVYNPEPVAAFFDAFVIGDGEEVIHDVLDVQKAWKATGGSRADLLDALAGVEGVYVPSLYDVSYHQDGRVAQIAHRAPAPATVLRRVVADLDGAAYPTDPILPIGKAVFDRVNVEVTRGCTHGCRFCQAGYTYRPVRERSPERVKELVLESLKNTGQAGVTLSSLSTGDYLCLYPLMKDLVDATMDRKISFSLPSLRIGTLTPAVVRQIKRVTKTGFTMAPEAGSERLRRVINKPISEEDLLKAVHNVFLEGWPEIKFYFMYGLPTETQEDLDGIAELVEKAIKLGRTVGGKPRALKVSTSNYVPKPMTPFQWMGQMSLQELDQRRRHLQGALRHLKMVKFTWKDARVSQLEATFSRGDRRLGQAVKLAFERGLRMDAWEEMCDVEAWAQVFADCGLDPEFYAHRDIPLDEVLPWDMIDCGTSKAYFAADYARAMRERIIKDCRYGLCGDCGVCTTDESGALVVPRVYAPEGGRAEEFDLPLGEDTENHLLVPELTSTIAEPSTTPVPEGRFRYRVQWTKLGDFAFLSHLEMLSLFTRAFRQADLPLAMSQGYHPRPKLSFGPALAMAVESLFEVMDVTLTAPVDPEDIRSRLNEGLPEGVVIPAVTVLSKHDRNLDLDGMGYAYELYWRDGLPKDLDQRIKAALAQDEISVARTDKKGRLKPFDLRPMIREMVIRDDHLYLFLASDGPRSARIPELLAGALGVPEEGLADIHIRRVGILYADGGQFYSLVDTARAAPYQPLHCESHTPCLQK